jgi:hypothetical protein
MDSFLVHFVLSFLLFLCPVDIDSFDLMASFFVFRVHCLRCSGFHGLEWTWSPPDSGPLSHAVSVGLVS